MNEQSEFEIVVVGAGPAGLLAGLCCAASNLQTAVIGPLADSMDGRTAALLNGSVNLLKRLSIWNEIKGVSEPLFAIRLVDATGSLLRAPEVLFEASEIGLEAFGYNVPNAALTSALDAAAGARLTRIVSHGVTEFDLSDERARVATSEGGSITARLVVAADGRASAARTAAGIAVSSWSYQQVAIVTTFAHSRPHRGISTELHRHTGPLTVVPGPGNTSSLVWVEAPAGAVRLLALDDSNFAKALERHLNGLLGTLSAFAPRRSFPLAGHTAAVMANNRVALVGEAAHMMPPIGAQGLNLSFRDAATACRSRERRKTRLRRYRRRTGAGPLWAAAQGRCGVARFRRRSLEQGAAVIDPRHAPRTRDGVVRAGSQSQSEGTRHARGRHAGDGEPGIDAPFATGRGKYPAARLTPCCPGPHDLLFRQEFKEPDTDYHHRLTAARSAVQG